MASCFFTFLSFLLGIPLISGDLEGEMMKISELNPGFDAEKLKIFECPEGQDCQVGNANREPTCLERRRMTGLDGNGTDKYVVVAGETGRMIQLECHYCNERAEPVPKVWYYYEKFLASKRFKLVPLHLEYPPESRKFVVDEEDHRLIIKNFTEADGALYFCQGLDDDSPKFNFLLDAVGDLGELEPRRGSAADFLEYHKENVAPLNKKLRDEYESDLKKWFSTNSSLHSYSVSHKWSKWGRCHTCGREHGVSIRTGICQLSIPTLAGKESGRKRGRSAMDYGYEFSCHSTMLKRFLTSQLRKSVNSILDFIEELPCEGECSLAGLGPSDTAELIASSVSVEPPAVVTVIGTLGESVTLLCADDPAADVVWLKDNKILSLSDASRMDQRSVGITYTRNRGGLYFRALNESQAGLYTCIFDDLVKMLFELETQEPVTEAPIPETWIWIHLGTFSVVCLIIWIFLIVIISRITRRTRSQYQPLSSAEEIFLQRKGALMDGRDDTGRNAENA